MRKSQYWKRLVCILIVLCSTQAYADTARHNANNDLVFGVLPFLSPVVLIKRFAPLKAYLEKVTGRTISLESAPNFSTFVKRTLDHQYDIIFTAPHFVPLTLQDDHYQLIAASNKLAAHIMVKGDSKLHNIEQLAGKRIALGPRQAFIVIITRYLLKTKGLTGKRKPIYSTNKSHNATLRALEFNDADAAVIGTYLLGSAEKKGYREIAATAYYPGAVIILSKDLSGGLREKVTNTFLNLKHSKEGRKTLKLIRFPGFQKTRATDYASLRPVAADALKNIDDTVPRQKTENRKRI